MPLVRPFFIVLLPALAVTIAACVAPPASADAPEAKEVVAALIVKPRVRADAEAVVTMMRTTLGRAAGVRYVRPMSDDAHVVHLTAPATRADVPQLIERLRATQGYVYVEPDVMMKKYER